MQKVFTLQNFHFLSQPKSQSPLEEIKVNLNALHEGELGVIMPTVRIQGLKGSMRESDACELNTESKGRQDEGTLQREPNLKF